MRFLSLQTSAKVQGCLWKSSEVTAFEVSVVIRISLAAAICMHVLSAAENLFNFEKW